MCLRHLFLSFFFFFNDTATTEIYTLSLHDALPISLSEALIREQKLQDAESYVKRAVAADPNSWRGHAILADVLLKENLAEEAVKEADRAIEMGHGQATAVDTRLVGALMGVGIKDSGGEGL